MAFVFPGQGSQRRGMGQGLFDEVPEFRDAEQEVDAILGYSVRRLCLEDPDNLLKETQYTQPCLYVVNALHSYKMISQEGSPEFVAGHSLGEYNALLTAGAFDFLTGLRLVQKRGALMAQIKNGGMAAVLGLDMERILSLIRESGLSRLDVANINSPSQIVLSGPATEIEKAKSVFEASGARMFMPLAVSAAFHSRYMVEVGQKFDAFLASFAFRETKIPVISNVTGKPYPQDATTTGPLLVMQISQPVQWTKSIHFLLRTGVSCFREAGPGNVLTRLVQQIGKEVTDHNQIHARDELAKGISAKDPAHGNS